MRNAIGLILLALTASALGGGAQGAENGDMSMSSVGSSMSGLAGLPLFFEAHDGQSGAARPFVARGHNYEFALWPTEADIALRSQSKASARTRPGRVNLHHASIAPASTAVVRQGGEQAADANVRFARMQLVGANPMASMRGTDELAGKINYLLGNDPAQWRSGMATFAKVQVQDVYPGIDLVYYGNQQELEYDFTIAPGADPAAIRLRFEGIESLVINDAGELVLRLGDGEIRQHRPILYQMAGTGRKPVSGGYKLADAQTVTFEVGPYEHDRALIIDPIFNYSTYFGGAGGDAGYVVKVDANGNIYFAGETLSTVYAFTIPTNAFQRSFKGGTIDGDAFVAKLNSTGSQLVYFTYLGGTNDEAALDLALDSAGNAYLTGFTSSGDFPTKTVLFSKIGGTNSPFYHNDAFVAELNTNGSALVFSTFLGGSADDVGTGIAVDVASNVYVTGYTYSTNFPLANAVQSFLAGVDDVFVAKLAPNGARLVYCTYLGGIGSDEGQGIAADATGHAYVTGYTHSLAFFTLTNATQTNITGGLVYDAFVTKFSAFGTNIFYSTFVGGTNDSFAYRIALDSLRNAYITGTSISPDFPQTGPVYGLQVGNNGTSSTNYDAFVTKFDPTGVRVYSALFGGTNDDVGEDIGVDGAGRAFVVGFTTSSNFPVVAPFGLLRATNSGLRDVFVTGFGASGTFAKYSAYLGGTDNDYGYGIAVDAESSAYITGVTYSTNFPVSVSPFQATVRGPSSAFLAKLRLFDPVLTATVAGGNLLLRWPATASDYALQSATNLSARSVWTPVPQTPVLTNGSNVVTLGLGADLMLFRLYRH